GKRLAPWDRAGARRGAGVPASAALAAADALRPCARPLAEAPSRPAGSARSAARDGRCQSLRGIGFAAVNVWRGTFRPSVGPPGAFARPPQLRPARRGRGHHPQTPSTLHLTLRTRRVSIVVVALAGAPLIASWIARRARANRLMTVPTG